MPLITLTSDWGTADHYAGAVRGTILSLMPEAKIVDISHHIPPFNLYHASFVVRNSFRSFPAGTVHLIDIHSGGGHETPHCIVRAAGHTFVGSDNGLFSLILDTHPDEIIALDIPGDSACLTFAARDIFSPAVVHMAGGGDASALGKPRPALRELMPFSPAADSNVIRGKVIYVDAYENVFVNITEKQFKQIGRGRPFAIYLRSESYEIRRLSENYGDVGEGELIALFSSSGYLEIAINRGKASSLCGLRVDDMVRIEFAG